MEIVATLDAPCGPERLYREVEDLDRYPAWMDLVYRAEREPATPVPVWDVQLRARLGSLARSKRLRMERTEAIPSRLVVFERREVDGRDHAAWILRAELFDISDTAASPAMTRPAMTRLVMTLRYGGSLWTGAALRVVLDEQIRSGSRRLLELVSNEPMH